MGTYDKDGNFRSDMSDREIVHRTWKWITGGIVVLLGLAFVTWGLGIVTAPWVGRQNVQRMINAPANQQFQYEHFFTLDADIHTDAKNLITQEAQAKTHRQDYPPGSPDPVGANATEQARLDSIVTGTSNHCQGLVRQYNNDAQEYTKDPFLSSKLPVSEDPTQCEVSQ